tara:strand:- start:142 stop:408 length:267 start_codon:yes stop_codon:yes gene_type:complete
MDLIPRTTYDGHFANEILSFFYSPDRHSGSAMECADKFRDDEWRVIDDAPYAHHTRSDLYEIGKNDKELLEFIVDVIQCMRTNVENSE